MKQTDPPLTLEACWRVLHTVYQHGTHENIADDGMMHFTTTLCMLRRDRRSSLGPVWRTLAKTVVKSAVRKKRDTYQHHWLRRLVLLLWSSLSQPTVDLYIRTAVLSGLVLDLKDWYEQASSDTQPDQTTHPTNGRRPASVSMPQSSLVPIAPASSIPYLCEDTSLLFTELVGSVIVGVWAVSPVSSESDVQQQQSPFQHLSGICHVFASYVGIGTSQVTRQDGRFMTIIFHVCTEFLKLVERHAHECASWRQKQPIPSEDQGYDPGSIQHLHSLLEGLVSGAIQPVVKLCEHWQEECRNNNDSSNKNKNDQALRKIERLLNLSSKVRAAVRQVATNHNIQLSESVPIGSGSDSAGMEGSTRVLSSSMASSRSRVACVWLARKGYHEVTSSDETSDLEEDSEVHINVPVGSEARRASKRPKLTNQDDDGEVESQDGDGFGVSGDWGKDDDASDDSSSSLVLDQPNLFG